MEATRLKLRLTCYYDVILFKNEFNTDNQGRQYPIILQYYKK